ncbi:hypothetical protein [Brevundimonas sp.]|uniref:hypothetical protein n=1 Tax=Brevundimonas sp. TaxID=1871086 RepID=UPI002D43001A|nr:hypothetical protein [Brevundimonas sp.]HYD27374.1 hypothetical protein [Brevundimonas sp.]
MIAMVMAAALSAAPGCEPPPGTEALLAMDRRFIIVGEDHGTEEIPAAFARIVCAAAAQGPVIVALELADVMQPRLDAFLEAPDDASAAAALHDTPFWNLRIQDGRSSAAMLDMMQSVRRLKADGHDVSFSAFRPSDRRVEGFDQNYDELEMAVRLARAAKTRPRARVLVLVGDFHAMKARIPGDDLLGAAALLPPADVVSLEVAQQGGQSWSCVADRCGPRDIAPAYPRPDERGIVLRPSEDGLYDGVLALGPLTPSPPAAQVQPAAISSGSSS